MKNTILLFVSSLFIYSSCTPYYRTKSPVSRKQIKISKEQTIDEDGVCWQESVMPSVYKDEVKTYNVFTGDASKEEVELEDIVVEVKPQSGQWVKKKKSPHCFSENPEDCWVSCYERIPPVFETWTILKNITQSENFEVKTNTKKVLFKEGGYVEKQRVICDDKVSASLVMEVQKQLENKNFKTGAPAEKINELVRKGLNNYQRLNNLPVGFLNFQTLDKLGVDYSK